MRNLYRVRITFTNGKTSFCCNGETVEEVKQRVFNGLIPEAIRENVKEIEVTEKRLDR